MTLYNKTLISIVILFIGAIALTGCKREPTVSFVREVRPIIENHCIDCHTEGGAGYEASGFAMDSYDGVMKGTRNGPMVIAGDVEGSNILVLMEGRADPSIAMPHGDLDPASADEIATIRSWIAQGAKNN